jgi:hypothetical protein
MTYANLNSPEAQTKLTGKTKKKIVRVFQSAPYSHFSKAVEILQISPGTLAGNLGYSSHSYNDWRNNQKMPLVAAKLCDAWAKEKLSTPAQKDMPILIVKPKSADQLKWLMQTLVAMQIPFSEVK